MAFVLQRYCFIRMKATTVAPIAGRGIEPNKIRMLSFYVSCGICGLKEEYHMLRLLCIVVLSSALILSLWAFWLAMKELMSE